MKYLREFKTKKHFLIYALMALCIFIVLILPYFLIDQQQYSNHFSFSRFLKMLLASILGLTLGGLSNTTGVFGGVLLRRLSNAGVSSNTSAFVGTATLSFMGIFALKQFQYSNQIPVNRGKVQNNYSDSSLHNIMNESPVFEKLSDHTKDNIMANQKNTKDEKEDNIVSFADRNIIDSLQNEIANLKKLLGATEFDDYFTLLFKELKFDNFLSYSIRTPKEMKQYNKTNKSIDFRSEIFKNPEDTYGRWGLTGDKEAKEYAKNRYLKINIQDISSEIKYADLSEFKRHLIGEVGKSIIKSQQNIETKVKNGYYIFSYGAINYGETIMGDQLTFRTIFTDKTSSMDLTNSHRILQVTIIFNQCSDKYWQKKLDLCMKFIEDLK